MDAFFLIFISTLFYSRPLDVEDLALAEDEEVGKSYVLFNYFAICS